MKHLAALLTLTICCYATIDTAAQRGMIRNKIEKDMEKKYADPNQKKGREELDKVTYENDTRYNDPLNKTQAMMAFENIDYNKKGEVKSSTVDKIIFGKTGECYVTDEGGKNESWWVYNYADKANYMVMVRDKTAMKMPLINMQKMAEKAAQKEAERMEASAGKEGWQATDEYQDINGYKCRKFIYTYRSNPKYNSYEAWVSNEVKFDISGNYMMGARLSSYKFPAGEDQKEMINGFIVRSILFDKGGNKVSQRDLKEMKAGADERYFDMSAFQVNDVLDVLGGR